MAATGTTMVEWLRLLSDSAGRQEKIAEPVVQKKESAETMKLKHTARQVRFNLEGATVHEIEPYSEIYGIHPGTFAFEKNGFVVLLDKRTAGNWLTAATIGHNAPEDTDEAECLDSALSRGSCDET